MSPSKKLLLILAIGILVIGAVYAWLIFGNRGNKKSTAMTPPTKTTSEVKTEESPELKESSFKGKPDLKPVVPNKKGDDLGGVWNKDRTHYLFLDAKDEKLKWRDLNGKETLIASLKNLTPPLQFFWSPDEERALINADQDIYFITLKSGSRKKVVADFKPTKVLWLSEKIWMNDTDENVFEVDFESSEKIKKTNLKINLDQSKSIDLNRVLSYKTEGGKTILSFIDPVDFTQKILTERSDFLAKDMDYSTDKKMFYLQESETGKWYEIAIPSI